MISLALKPTSKASKAAERISYLPIAAATTSATNGHP
jgi:hypothetical protein